MNFRHILLTIALVVLASIGGSAQASANAPGGVLRVAAAADLKMPLDEIGRAFEKKTGVRVEPSLGASGTLFAQISNGAPFQVFMSADRDYPKKLADAGMADSSTLTNYARGTLVLWMSDAWVQRAAGRKVELKVLLDPSVQHVAIANPAHAPYGRAAEAALRSSGILDQVRSKIVMAENVAQAAQFVHSGNADAGFVALTAVGMNKDIAGRWVEVPRELYPPIEQAAIVTRAGQGVKAAKEFMEFLGSEEAKAVLRRYGFQ